MKIIGDDYDSNKYAGSNHTHKKILSHVNHCGACGDSLESFRAFCVFYNTVLCETCYNTLHKLNPHHKTDNDN